MCGLLVNGDDSRSAEIAEQTDRLESALDGLMERARRDGRLRPDVTLNDLLVAVSRLTRPLPGIDWSGSDLHRHLQLFLDGLRAPDPNQPYQNQPYQGDATKRTP